MEPLLPRLRPRRVARSAKHRLAGAGRRARHAGARRVDTLVYFVREVRARLTGRSRLHVSIKISAPDDDTAVVWGDLYFARDLAVPMRALGHDVRIDHINTRKRPTRGYRDDVVIHLRGLFETAPEPGAVNVLWVVSHPDLVTERELGSGYDVLFAASIPWAARMSEATGREIRPLLQATNPARFHPGAIDPALAADVLFVGKTRNNFRPIVRDAIAAGVDVDIYGDGWETFVSERLIRSQFLANEDVPAAYRSAKVVLNDHWEDMRSEGFLSNRLFDATASGAFVVSDDIEGAEDVFGSSVALYRTPDELAAILTSRVKIPNRAELTRNAQRIAAAHSFERRSNELLEAAESARRARITE